MILWITKISWKKVLYVSSLFTLFSFIIHELEAVLMMKYYLDPRHFGVWSKIMMPRMGPPPTEFFITSLIFSFITGISIAIIYYYLRGHLPENKTKRIFYFADLLVATSFVFFTLPVLLMLNVAVGLLVSWFVVNFICLTFSSFLCVKIID
jgi:hypothetical protein